LLGLRFKNTSGLHLTQGPVTVYEGGAYAGDGRILDLQPNEERFLSYAIDLGTEVKRTAATRPEQSLIVLKLAKDFLHVNYKVRQTSPYVVKNRSESDRQLIIEQPIRSDWKVVAPERPAQRTREVSRFELAVPAGKSGRLEVIEEQGRTDQFPFV